MELISVIVPVYKVEPYLDRCIQSIVDQTYRNLEIILVDDGSPDRCGAICDAWAAKDDRITVIHKKNGGSAQARNMGLDLAAGTYICFVDSDDYILPNMLHTLLTILQDTACDIAECGYHIVTSDLAPTDISVESNISCYTTEQALLENIHDNICRQLVWNKLYSRHVLENVHFVEQKYIDDEFFTYRVLAQAKKVAVSLQKLYCYRQQQDSAMHQHFSLKRLQAVEAKECRFEYLKAHYPSLLSAARIDLWQTCLYQGQMSLLYLQKKDRKTAFSLLHDCLTKHPLLPEDLHGLPQKRQIWLRLARHSLPSSCRLRNLLKRGL